MQENKQEKSLIKRNIMQYLDYKNISEYRLYKESGITRGVLSQNNGISEDNLMRFLAYAPDVNPQWLLTGRGGMLRDEDIQLAVPQVEQAFQLRTDKTLSLQNIPLYELDATAGLVALFNDKDTKSPVSHLQIPNLPPCDGAVYVRGDSMYPLLKSGDIVLYKEVVPTMEHILWGEMYLLSFNINGEDYIAIKYIQKGDDECHVRLVSHNPHHSSKDIPAEAIRALALVKASVRYNTMG